MFFGDAPAPVGYGDDLLTSGLNEQDPKRAMGALIYEAVPRTSRPPGTFYPILIDPDKAAWSVLANRSSRGIRIAAPGSKAPAAWPMRTDGSQGRWRIGPPMLRSLIKDGYVRSAPMTHSERRGRSATSPISAKLSRTARSRSLATISTA